jgi:hypothetical protein
MRQHAPEDRECGRGLLVQSPEGCTRQLLQVIGKLVRLSADRHLEKVSASTKKSYLIFCKSVIYNKGSSSAEGELDMSRRMGVNFTTVIQGVKYIKKNKK